MRNMSISEFQTLKEDYPFMPLGDLIYQCIYEDIIQLRIPPGAKLNESRLAEELDVSRTPIKNAIDRLLDEKLVQKKNGKTSVVSPMAKEESRQLFEARIAIEGYAAFLSAMRISAEQLLALERLTEQYTQIGQSLDPTAYADCDHSFHSIIIQSAQNIFISNMYSTIESRLRHYRHCLLHEIGRERLQPILLDAAKHHKTIYNALKFGFADVARQEIERDIAGMMDVFSAWR